MLRDCFSDESDEENEETTTVSSSGSEETTANWRKRGFKRKRIKRPRSSPGGTMGTDIQRNAPLLRRFFSSSWNCGTPSGSFPQNRIKQFFRHFSDNSFKLNKLNILTLQRLQKLQQKCIASSVKKGTLLRTSYLERMRKTMWRISPQKTSSLPSVLLRDPRIL